MAMERLTSASAFIFKKRLAEIYQDFLWLLNRTSLSSKSDRWNEFDQHFNAVASRFENFDQFQVGDLLRSIQSLAELFERVFAAVRPPEEWQEATGETKSLDEIRERLIQLFGYFGQFIKLEGPFVDK